MKIAQVVSTFPPYRGGMGSIAKEYSTYLAKLGHEVVVFTPAYSRLRNLPEFPFRVERLRPVFRFGNAAFVPQLIGKLKSFDVVHLHYPFFGGAEALNIAVSSSRNQKPRYIITYHMDNVGSGMLGMIYSWYRENIMPTIIENADKVLVSSEDYMKHSALKDIAEKKPQLFETLPFGVDTHRFFPKEKDQEFLKKNGLEPGVPIILFVGGMDRPHYFKGVDDLIRAAEILLKKNISSQFVFVGNGKLIASYKMFAENLGISKQVHFFEGVFDELLPKWYQSSDVFVLPSKDRSEAFGIVLLEAMASGIPVIASNLPGVRSVVQDGESGFLCSPSDPESISEKIKILLADDILRKKMGESAKKRVLEHYEWGKIIEQLVEVYTKS